MKYRIMVVDDSRVAYTELKRFLEDTDFEIVHHCRTGEDALDSYAVVKPDLVTMDIIMPGIDGLETATEMMRRWQNAKIVIVSSLAYDETINQAVAVGAKAILFKPFEKSQLVNTLQGVLK